MLCAVGWPAVTHWHSRALSAFLWESKADCCFFIVHDVAFKVIPYVVESHICAFNTAHEHQSLVGAHAVTIVDNSALAVTIVDNCALANAIGPKHVLLP